MENNGENQNACARTNGTDDEMVAHHVEMWYDRRTKSWVIQTNTVEGYQIGGATFVHSRREALAEKSEREQAIRTPAKVSTKNTTKNGGKKMTQTKKSNAKANTRKSTNGARCVVCGGKPDGKAWASGSIDGYNVVGPVCATCRRILKLSSHVEKRWDARKGAYAIRTTNAKGKSVGKIAYARNRAESTLETIGRLRALASA